MKLGSWRLTESWKTRQSPRINIIVWATAISIVVGAVDFSEPLDRAVQAGRDLIRSRPSAGKILVVNIDNKTIRSGGGLSRLQGEEARAIDVLFKQGARRVFIDHILSDPGLPEDAAALVSSLKRHRGKVFLAGTFEEDRVTNERVPELPADIFRANAAVGSVVVREDILGHTSGLPLNSEMGGHRYRSFSAILAGIPNESTEVFRPDYSISYRSIPSVSLLDVVNNKTTTSLVSGKDVLIGPSASSLGDIHSLPGQGFAPGVYIHAIGAETLRQRLPRSIGWFLPLIGMLAIAVPVLYVRRRKVRYIALASGFLIAVVLPFGLDALSISSKITPALLLLTMVTARGRILNRMIKNPVSGLPLLERAGRDEGLYAGTIVALKVNNFADLRSNLTKSEERELANEIARRARMGNPDLDIMQGGDSFVWKTPLPVSPSLCSHIEALHSVLSLPINIGSRNVDLTMAFGLDEERDRHFMNRAGSAEVSADQALAAGERWRVHDALRLQDADFRLSLLSQLDRAVSNGELWVAYQPKLDLKTRRICGAEALVRWLHPERGPIAPDKFILVAENANRIGGVTNLVLETAIRDAAAMSDISPEFSVAVNLSVRMLAQEGLIGQIEGLLKKYNLQASRLTLEVTESAEIDFNGPGIKMLCALRDMGIKISIDDYGTKYSTLDYVRRLPACEIKIDMRFINSVHNDEGSRIMVQSTIELAHSLGLTVVAEGVELQATIGVLSEMKCDVGQGYLIAKPQRIDDVRALLTNPRLMRVA